MGPVWPIAAFFSRGIRSPAGFKEQFNNLQVAVTGSIQKSNICIADASHENLVAGFIRGHFAKALSIEKHKEKRKKQRDGAEHKLVAFFRNLHVREVALSNNYLITIELRKKCSRNGVGPSQQLNLTSQKRKISAISGLNLPFYGHKRTPQDISSLASTPKKSEVLARLKESRHLKDLYGAKQAAILLGHGQRESDERKSENI